MRIIQVKDERLAQECKEVRVVVFQALLRFV